MRRVNKSAILVVLVIGLVVSALIGLSWVNYRYTVENPGGNDFLVHWVGMRALIMDDLSPYSDEVALRIQTAAYGRAALPGEHELRVAYPLYSGILFTPFAMIEEYPLARALWMTLLEISLLGTALLSMRIAGWRPGIAVVFFFLLFSVLWYHGVRPLINGNAVIVVGLLIAAALAAIRSEQDEWAGVFLAYATIKPQVVILLILFVLVWALSKRRWKLVVWTIGSVILLSFVSTFFVPNWILQNIQEVLRYPGYNPPGTPGAAFQSWWPGIGTQLGWGLTILLGILMVVEWFVALGKDFRWFFWTASLTLVISQWIGIQTDPGNFVVLLPVLVLVFGAMQERWGKSAWIGIVMILLLLTISLWVLFLATVEHGAQPQQHPIMFFPLPFILLAGMYWIRHWAIRPQNVFLDALRSI